METTDAGLTFRNILPLILALLLIFIIPMLMRRYGLTWSDIIRLLFSRPGKKKDYAEAAKDRKNRQEPWQTNGRSQDIQSLISTLLIFVRRHKLGLVYPGTVVHSGKMANLVALLVTREEVIGMNCFGFGGTITEKKGKWNQHMNGMDQAIADPLKANQEQARIVRSMMDENGMADIRFRVVAVFTGRTVTLQTEHPSEVFDTQGLLKHLKEQVSGQANLLDPASVSRQINGHVQRVKRGSASGTGMMH